MLTVLFLGFSRPSGDCKPFLTSLWSLPSALSRFSFSWMILVNLLTSCWWSSLSCSRSLACSCITRAIKNLSCLPADMNIPPQSKQFCQEVQSCKRCNTNKITCLALRSLKKLMANVSWSKHQAMRNERQERLLSWWLSNFPCCLTQTKINIKAFF